MMQKGRSQKILGCFDVDGCQEYAITTQILDAALMKFTPEEYPEYVAELDFNQLIKQEEVLDSTVVKTEHMDALNSCRSDVIPVNSDIESCNDQCNVK